MAKKKKFEEISLISKLLETMHEDSMSSQNQLGPKQRTATCLPTSSIGFMDNEFELSPKELLPIGFFQN
ncbi:hypothetical protein DOY81_003317 [Sarcophaga bullata]|nr:hypothetical protein DOY81_003317 [Sarcophaga bullata]